MNLERLQTEAEVENQKKLSKCPDIFLRLCFQQGSGWASESDIWKLKKKKIKIKLLSRVIL